MKPNTAINIISLLYLVTISCLAFAVIQIKIQNKNTAKALVYAVCQQSRQEVSGASEQACGDAQDQLNIEYLCKERNSLASNVCWTEAK